MSDPVRVFISYSHDSAEHDDRVLELSERLRADGLDCEIDQYEEAPLEGWPRWMQNQVERAEFVLVVCTRTYAERFLGRAPQGAGRGAKWEGAIITQEIHDAEAKNAKFVPVVLAGDDIEHIPGALRLTTRYDLSSSSGYETLYRRLSSQPKVSRGNVGSVRAMAPRARRAVSPAAATPTVGAPSAIPAAPPPANLGRDELAALLEAADLLSAPTTLERVLERILELAGRLTGSTAGAVILADPDRGDLYFAAASGPKRDEVLAMRMPRGKGKAGEVFDTGQPLLENVVVGHYAEIDRTTHFATRSMLCVPLEHGAERFGVMQVLNKADGREAFGVGDLALCMRFAAHAAVAIERARLFERLLASSGLYALPEVRRDLSDALSRPGRIALKERMSVLSADMRGFTAMSHALGPERLQTTLGEYVTGMAAEIVSRGGIVNKLVGDAVLAIFRGPQAASRAIAAAFAMLDAFDQLRVQWRARSSASLAYVDLGVGIASDEETILGTIGNERFRDFTLIGPSVLLATALAKVGAGDTRLRVDRATLHQAGADPATAADGPEAFRLKDAARGASPEYEIFRLRRV